jgi:hypothetical protein
LDRRLQDLLGRSIANHLQQRRGTQVHEQTAGLAQVRPLLERGGDARDLEVEQQSLFARRGEECVRRMERHSSRPPNQGFIGFLEEVQVCDTLWRPCHSKTKRIARIVAPEKQCTKIDAFCSPRSIRTRSVVLSEAHARVAIPIRYDSIPCDDSEDKLTADPLALLDDQAVYRRTPAGQRELTNPHGQLSTLERRFLSAVTGHTPIRVLLDLGLDKPGIGNAIVSLVARGLIKLEESP